MNISGAEPASPFPERLAAAIADRYLIRRELGAGGMATVYLADDIKHDRRVAVKVLRPELAAVIGADRFLAEIKTTANLQHPHILPLHDSGSVDSFLFYVMPYIEGESLRQRLNREHQLPVVESVRLATEIAGALDYAHRHGVVHRDIKPENILLHDGRAQVADFGIALAVSTAGTRMTETGMSLGTPHYMSPEQAMGEREITARSDVYALGCVTYEMLVGEPPFTGPTAQAIVARVMTEEPRGLTIQRKSIPLHVESAVRIALSKLPADRFATAAEFAAALNDPSSTTAAIAFSPAVRKKSRRELVLVGALALIGGIGVGALVRRPAESSDRGVVRMMMTLPDSGGLVPLENTGIAISPDGERIAYIGPSKTGRMLWVREMNDFQGRPLPGTEDAQGPFFSPDGEFIGFFGRGSNTSTLKVTPAAGGVVRTVRTDSVSAFGGSWGEDGRIYFDSQRGIGSVPAEGGQIVMVARPDTARQMQELDFPHVLPGAKGLLVQIWKGSPAQNEIGTIDIKTGKVVSITKGTYAVFFPPNHLLYGSAEGRIFSVEFDAAKLAIVGEPVQVLDNVQGESTNGTMDVAVSKSGILIYVPGAAINREVMWVGRDGKRTRLDSSWAGAFSNPALSPDGGRLAVTIAGLSDQAVWVKRLSNGSLTRLTFSGSSDRPAWAPDGQSVAYLGTRQGKRSAWIRRADGSNEEQLVNKTAPKLDEISFAPDGSTLILRTQGTTGNTRKLLISTLGSNSTPRPLVHTDFDNFSAILSPNGKWLAYVSNESRQDEVYVRPFPSVDSARWTISSNGGTEPLWSHSGRELFYRSPRGEMMRVEVTAGANFQTGAPSALFTDAQLISDDRHRGYDISPDDQRFITVGGAQKNSQLIGVVLNWGSEIRRLGKRK